jgi:predicted acylesterase/phospholipase RssA
MPFAIPEIRASRTLARYAPKIVYVLSGGAAKGFYHLGMIEELEHRGVTPDLVVGTSAGSLFGSLYCHSGTITEVFRREKPGWQRRDQRAQAILLEPERDDEERHAAGQGDGHLGDDRGG